MWGVCCWEDFQRVPNHELRRVGTAIEEDGAVDVLLIAAPESSVVSDLLQDHWDGLDASTSSGLQVFVTGVQEKGRRMPANSPCPRRSQAYEDVIRGLQATVSDPVGPDGSAYLAALRLKPSRDRRSRLPDAAAAHRSVRLTEGQHAWRSDPERFLQELLSLGQARTSFSASYMPVEGLLEDLVLDSNLLYDRMERFTRRLVSTLAFNSAVSGVSTQFGLDEGVLGMLVDLVRPRDSPSGSRGTAGLEGE